MSETYTPVNTGIVLAAGRGARLGDLTGFTDKPMMRLGNPERGPQSDSRYLDSSGGVPLINSALSDLALAGVSECLIVTGTRNSHIKDYYGNNIDTEDLLSRQGDRDRLEAAEHPSQEMLFSYMVQDTSDLYGTGVPIYLAARWLRNGGGDQFFAVSGDIFMRTTDGSAPTANLLKASQDSSLNAKSGLVVAPIERSEASRYGIVLSTNIGGQSHFEQMIEHPEPYQVPEHETPQINASELLLDLMMLDCIEEAYERHVRGNSKDELRYNAAFQIYREELGLPIVVSSIGDGTFIDCGKIGDLAQASRIVEVSLARQR